MAYPILLVRSGNFGILQQTNDRKARVRWVEERTRSAVSSPVVLPGSRLCETLHQPIGAAVGSGTIHVLMRCSIEFRRRHQGAIVVEDVFNSIIQKFDVMLVQEPKGGFGCF